MPFARRGSYLLFLICGVFLIFREYWIVSELFLYHEIGCVVFVLYSVDVLSPPCILGPAA